MKSFIIILLSLVLLSCQDFKPVIVSNGKLTLIDSTNTLGNLLEFNSKDRMGFYPIFYLGLLKDTIKLGKEAINDRISRQEESKYRYNKRFTFADSNKIKISIDTSSNLTYNLYFKNFDESQTKWVLDSTKSYKSFAVFVQNLSDSLISVGEFNNLGEIIRQAKNESGNWVDIEIPIKYFCGTGARLIVLEPKAIAVAKLLRYKGNFKTECRLKYSRWGRTVYSNSFTDFIDKRQLILPAENYF